MGLAVDLPRIFVPVLTFINALYAEPVQFAMFMVP